jgi:hypothetical protein
MEDPPKLLVKLLSERASVPERATSGAAGYDLRASFSCAVPPNGKAQVHTGISLQIPPGYYGRIAPRSSTAWNDHIDVGAGVIDSDYRGEVVVVLFNHSSQKRFEGAFYFYFNVLTLDSDREKQGRSAHHNQNRYSGNRSGRKLGCDRKGNGRVRIYERNSQRRRFEQKKNLRTSLRSNVR